MIIVVVSVVSFLVGMGVSCATLILAARAVDREDARVLGSRHRLAAQV
jgi:hypothetical protein